MKAKYPEAKIHDAYNLLAMAHGYDSWNHALLVNLKFKTEVLETLINNLGGKNENVFN